MTGIKVQSEPEEHSFNIENIFVTELTFVPPDANPWGYPALIPDTD